jgi:poly-gamma-glutamate synthesis protein (capsule biosynthesis protein)
MGTIQDIDLSTGIDADADLLFAGDIALPDDLSYKSVSENLQEQIRSTAFSIANLEGVIPYGIPNPKPGPIVSTRETTPEILASIGFDGVSLANNHAMDYGYPSLKKTANQCRETGLETVGEGRSETSAIKPISLEVNGSDVAVFAATQREMGIASRDQSGVAWAKSQPFLNRISESVSNHDLVIVVAHGGIEFVPLPPPSWQKYFRELVETGADAVIGHHPHVTQGWESYQGSPIFYSLGNFLFKSSRQSDTRGAMIQFEISDGDLDSCDVVLIENDDGFVKRESDETRDSHCQYLDYTSNLIKDMENNPGYWQEISETLYEHKYSRELRDFGSGRFCSLLNTPLKELDRMARGIINDKTREAEQERQLFVYLQGEVHREIIRTTTGLRCGTIPDYRDEATVEEVKELLEWTELQPDRDLISENIRRIKTGIDRLQ